MFHHLEIDAVEFRVRRKIILKEVKLECRTGQVIGLLGRNGSGKSTLLKILFGIQRPTMAHVRLDGALLELRQAHRHAIAYSPQDITLPKDITVSSLVQLVYEDALSQDRILGTAGMYKLVTKKIRHLSLGEQKYLQFLMTIHSFQHFILLDEPFSMVDPLQKENIKAVIQEMRATKGFIVTDHYYRDVNDVSDNLIVMDMGVTRAASTTADLVRLGYLPPRKP
ncbi:ABC-type multidrug transport system, ATPase component [Chitinophaga costaii]|uniref:ABC-type multidrug transport system, ATPase component n=1 Tax=Chitinophaga costaii TaxID=1335309 RepID=A0A1C4EHD0_9BACT|nr:ATP-binding cassette domain-containing protein [Chitinophaga costaii]PUZ23817.1 ABC transporter ATP-binding protein [Chitinophaga costaii]SCC43036.1 ABC-type multidrug transport system, ATPase component [Chitinophaga costaii]